MSEDEFWQIIEASNAERSSQNLSLAEIVEQKLLTLPADDVLSFGRIFSQFLYRAYRWDVLAAAYLINQYAQGDAFAWFRASLIGLGRDAYYEALRDPETLANHVSGNVDFLDEDLLVVADVAYEALTGDFPPDDGVRHPKVLEGEPCDLKEAHTMFPALAKADQP